MMHTDTMHTGMTQGATMHATSDGVESQEFATANPAIGAAIEPEMPGDARQTDTLADEVAAAPATDEAKSEETRRVRYRAKPKFAFPLHVRAVAVDLDGTLLDTAQDIATAANNMRRAFGFAPLDAAVVRNFIGRGIANLVAQVMKDAVGELGSTALKVAVGQFEKQYAKCFAETSRAYPNAVAGLEAMRDKGLRLACVTNKGAAFTVPLLERTGLASYFSLVVSGDTLPQKKPHPAPLLHVASEFGIDVAQLLLIGDSTSDAEAARAAGCPVFIVPYGYNGGQELRGLDCDAFIDDLTGFAKYVKIAA